MDSGHISEKAEVVQVSEAPSGRVGLVVTVQPTTPPEWALEVSHQEFLVLWIAQC